MGTKLNTLKATPNDCYSCPFRGTVAGSAHSSCHVLPTEQRAKILQGLFLGAVPVVKVAGKEAIQFNPHGIANGWCNYPVNFDPVWITCRLPVEEIKTLLDQNEKLQSNEKHA